MTKQLISDAPNDSCQWERLEIKPIDHALKAMRKGRALGKFDHFKSISE